MQCTSPCLAKCGVVAGVSLSVRTVTSRQEIFLFHRKRREERKIYNILNYYHLEALEVGQELDGALASEEVAVDHATDTHHSEAAVLDLGKCIALGGLGVLAKAKGIKLEVAGGALALEGLEKGDGAEHLEEGDPEEDLTHGSLLDEHVMEGSHLGATSKAGVRRISGNVLEDGTSGGEHGNAAVLDLSLTEEADVSNTGQAEGIEANVTWHAGAEGRVALKERDRLGHGLHGGAAGR